MNSSSFSSSSSSSSSTFPPHQYQQSSPQHTSIPTPSPIVPNNTNGPSPSSNSNCNYISFNYSGPQPHPHPLPLPLPLPPNSYAPHCPSYSSSCSPNIYRNNNNNNNNNSTPPNAIHLNTDDVRQFTSFSSSSSSSSSSSVDDHLIRSLDYESMINSYKSILKTQTSIETMIMSLIKNYASPYADKTELWPRLQKEKELNERIWLMIMSLSEWLKKDKDKEEGNKSLLAKEIYNSCQSNIDILKEANREKDISYSNKIYAIEKEKGNQTKQIIKYQTQIQSLSQNIDVHADRKIIKIYTKIKKICADMTQMLVKNSKQ